MASLGALRWLATIVVAVAVVLTTGECVTAAVLADYQFYTIVPTSTNPYQELDQSSADLDPNTTATDVAGVIQWTDSANGNPPQSIFMGGKFVAEGEIGPTISTKDFLVFNVAPNAGQQMSLQSLRFD
ncbi:MAG: hypothetical protein L0228_07965, partial [Planctomycetes bacterium]|nr:hypothetical protein [Planctomycetota bacterium]